MDRRLLALALGMFALGTDSYVVAGVLPQISQSFGVSIGAAGQLTSVYAIAFALMSPTIAALAATVSRRKMLLLGLTVFVSANLLTALAPSFAIALLSRVIAGVGAAMFSPTATGTSAMIVTPERRGYALSIVMAGLSASTALGSPIGAVIGGIGDWRWTMALVAVMGLISALGISFFLKDVPLPPAISLRQRLAPLADVRVGLTLITTLIAMAGTFTVYTYFAVVFDRAVDGNPVVMGILLALWGLTGTIANLVSGRIIDRISPRKVVLVLLSLSLVNLTLLYWSGANAWTAGLAIALWGALAWGILVPQQHRLVSLAPPIATVLLGLSTAGTYFGMSAAAVIGAASIPLVGAHNLGMIGAALLAVALLMSELAGRSVEARQIRQAAVSTA